MKLCSELTSYPIELKLCPGLPYYSVTLILCPGLPYYFKKPQIGVRVAKIASGILIAIRVAKKPIEPKLHSWLSYYSIKFYLCSGFPLFPNEIVSIVALLPNGTHIVARVAIVAN